MNKQGSSIYNILVFVFNDTLKADYVVDELKASQKLGGYKVVAEAVVNSMQGYKANVVTVTLGDELSGTIAQATEAEVQVPASQTGQAAKETPNQ
jgi:hypothetical protein